MHSTSCQSTTGRAKKKKEKKKRRLTSTGWKTMSSAIPENPDPSTRAVPDSFLPVIGGDMMVRWSEREQRAAKGD